MVPEHRKIESCCSVVLFAFFLRFPAPSSLVQIRLRIKTKQDATLAQVAAQQPLVSNKASSNSFFLWSIVGCALNRPWKDYAKPKN